VIRPERPADAAAIERVVARAFVGHPHSDGSEPALVRRLRTAGALSLSLVAVEDDVVVGHVAVSPVTMSDGTPGWHGVGPLSVEPTFQRRGLGAALMRAAIDDLRPRSAGLVLLGNPEYYARFGFLANAGPTLPGYPATHFQALAFTGAPPVATVSYHPAFGV
jgi:putative acetyltransferase